jgi:hypothetical protein
VSCQLLNTLLECSPQWPVENWVAAGCGEVTKTVIKFPLVVRRGDDTRSNVAASEDNANNTGEYRKG